MTTRVCDYCGDEFKPKREHGRFCSPKHRRYWNRANPGVTGDTRPPVTGDSSEDLQRRVRELEQKNFELRSQNYKLSHLPRQRRYIDGKTSPQRLRELQKERAAEHYLEAWRFQVDITRLCSILETLDVREYDGADDVLAMQISAIYDNLASLQQWLDPQLLAVTGYLGELATREKIAKLRNVTGRTSEEAAAYLRLADKLERQLENRLE